VELTAHSIGFFGYFLCSLLWAAAHRWCYAAPPGGGGIRLLPKTTCAKRLEFGIRVRIPEQFLLRPRTPYHQFAKLGIRVAPPATVRKGSFIASNVVLMPSYVNIGAYVDSGTLVDTWATVGSCAQIGKHVHLSGGVGIGGVLEPLQASPTIIEDNCFIGARSEIVEGVIVGEGSVISMGVYIGQSTKIYHRETGAISYGRIPPGSVVVAGNLPAKDGRYSLYCAVIVKQVDAKTRAKVGINELLRAV
jgi:2,3,4,5-tetrahydropyridine-2,6-dicarboxylate N-succinyltransferase